MTDEPRPHEPPPAPAGPPLSERINERRGRFVAGHARAFWGHAQNRNASYLMMNNVLNAATGLLFWLLIARLTGLSPTEVGVGFSVIALGTLVGVIAKGGLDTALVRHVPRAARGSAQNMFLLALGFGGLAAILLTLFLAAASTSDVGFSELPVGAWLLVATIALMLVVTWLQDAYFLADGDARHSFQRNVIFATSRLLLPFAVIALAWPYPVALTWAIALALSALGATFFALRLAPRDGPAIDRSAFLRSARRNMSGNAAEFVPGLLLAPLVLAMSGAEQAAYFGIAWTAASLLFLASGAISRSALAELVRQDRLQQAATLRRGIRQHVAIVVPAAVAFALLAPLVLSFFGADYAREGSASLTILAASIVVVAPAYYYLAVLRANERVVPLTVYPLAMIAALAVLAPPLASRLGIEGVALAWFLSNTPFAAYAAWRLRPLARLQHTPPAPPRSVENAGTPRVNP